MVWQEPSTRPPERAHSKRTSRRTDPKWRATAKPPHACRWVDGTKNGGWILGGEGWTVEADKIERGSEGNQPTDAWNGGNDDVQLKTTSFAGRRVVGRNQARAVRASRVAIVAAAVRSNRTLQSPNPKGPTKTRRVERLTCNDRS